MTASRLLSLPPELLEQILQNVDAHSLVTCMLTCSQLKTAVELTPSLHFALKLASSGMKEGPDNSLPVTERSLRLDAYNAAWRTLTWSQEDTIQVEGNELEEPSFQLCGNVVVVPQGRGVFQFYQLPSPLRGIEARRWSLTFDFAVDSYAADPSQDLLVLVVYIGYLDEDIFDVHFLSLSTGGPHPGAVSAKWIGMYKDGEYPIELCGEYIAFRHPRSLHVLDWKKWTPDSDSFLSIDFSVNFDFCFLDCEHVLVLPAEWASGGPTILVYECSAPANGSLATPLFAFSFPKFPAKDLLGVYLTGSVDKHIAEPSTSSGYFSSLANAHLLTVTLQCYDDPHSLPFHQLVILSTAFTSRLSHKPLSPVRCRHFDWDEWAPGRTYVFANIPDPTEFPLTISTYVHECKMIERYGHEPEREVRVLDFHPQRISEAQKTGEFPDVMTSHLNEGSIIDLEAVHYTQLSLPYTSSHGTLPENWDRQPRRQMITDDSIVLVSVKRDQTDTFKLHFTVRALSI